MEILVKTSTGKTITSGDDASDTINIVKVKITAKEGFPPDKQLFTFASQAPLT